MVLPTTSTLFNAPVIVTFASAFAVNTRVILLSAIIPLVGFLLSLQAFECTSCLSYLPSSLTFIAVVYVASQIEVLQTF